MSQYGDNTSGRGAFRGGRGYHPSDENQHDFARGGFRGGRGRGDYGESQQRNNYAPHGGFDDGGRGNRLLNNTQNDNSGFARGGFRGGRGDYQQRNEYVPRGGFNDGDRGLNRYSPLDDNSEFARGGFRGGRGRGSYGDNQQRNNYAPRGGFDDGGRGNRLLNDNQHAISDFARGGFRGGRGRGANGDNQQRNDYAPRGGFDDGGRGRGNYGQRNNNDGLENDRFEGPGFAHHRIENVEAAADRAPFYGRAIGYTPKSRKVEELYEEDASSANLYAGVADLDDYIEVENFKEQVVRIPTWEEAELEPQLLVNVQEKSRYAKPRNIQAVTIPFVVDDFDIKSHAETGSGKTGAYLIPIIDICMKAKRGAEGVERYEPAVVSPYALVILPTRELAQQVYEQATKFADGTGTSVAKAYGRYDTRQNYAEICAGCDILIGTPGRLKEIITRGELLVKKIKFLVLDEADRLLCDESFYNDILDTVGVSGFPDKNNRQSMLFSATFPAQVKVMADKFLKAEAVFVTNKRDLPNRRIRQSFIAVTAQEKLEKLYELLQKEAEQEGGTDKIRRTLVFVNTKRMSEMAAMYLCTHGIPATSINSDRFQLQREMALAEFRTRQVPVLISTNVCARGIDVKQLDHVINMEMPNEGVIYVHRIGRTGRICPGFATSFIEAGHPVLKEIGQMFVESGEEIPETLKTMLDEDTGVIRP